MDESFQDYLKISELFKPSILKLEEIFMPHPTSFGDEFNEIKNSDDSDITIPIQPNNLTCNKKSIFLNYKEISTQFSEAQNDEKINTSPHNIHSSESDGQIDQDLESIDDSAITFDDFAKIFTPVVSKSLNCFHPEEINSLIVDMFNQSQNHLNSNKK